MIFRSETADGGPMKWTRYDAPSAAVRKISNTVDCGRSLARPPSPRRHQSAPMPVSGCRPVELRYEADPDYVPAPEEP